MRSLCNALFSRLILYDFKKCFYQYVNVHQNSKENVNLCYKNNQN
jgi:hypothetical protein